MDSVSPSAVRLIGMKDPKDRCKIKPWIRVNLCCGKSNWVIAIFGTASNSIAGEEAIIKPHQKHDDAEKGQQAPRVLCFPAGQACNSLDMVEAQEWALPLNSEVVLVRSSGAVICNRQQESFGLLD